MRSGCAQSESDAAAVAVQPASRPTRGTGTGRSSSAPRPPRSGTTVPRQLTAARTCTSSTSPNCAMELGLLCEIFSLEEGYEGGDMKLVVLKDEDMDSQEPIEILLRRKMADQEQQLELFWQAYESCKAELLNDSVTTLLDRWISDFERAGGDTAREGGSARRETCARAKR